MVCNCPTCGAVVDPKAACCQFCGTALEHKEQDYEAEKQYETFYNSCMELNLDNPKQIHTYWWALVLVYIVANFIVMHIIADKDSVYVTLAIVHVVYYTYAQGLIGMVANRYVSKVVFPKAPDTVANVIDFIEEQLKKNSKKSMFRLRNCI